MGRLHIPGGCYHLIGRGLERRYIFEDSTDKQNFLDRLGKNLDNTQCQCLAWALMPNHYHLLVRAGSLPLSKLMAPVLDGYGGWTLDKLIRRVCGLCDIEEQALLRKARSNNCSKAKALAYFRGTLELGLTTTEIAEHLQISQQAISKWTKKDQTLVESSSINFPDSGA